MEAQLRDRVSVLEGELETTKSYARSHIITLKSTNEDLSRSVKNQASLLLSLSSVLRTIFEETRSFQKQCETSQSGNSLLPAMQKFAQSVESKIPPGYRGSSATASSACGRCGYATFNEGEKSTTATAAVVQFCGGCGAPLQSSGVVAETTPAPSSTASVSSSHATSEANNPASFTAPATKQGQQPSETPPAAPSSSSSSSTTPSNVTSASSSSTPLAAAATASMAPSSSSSLAQLSVSALRARLTAAGVDPSEYKGFSEKREFVSLLLAREQNASTASGAAPTSDTATAAATNTPASTNAAAAAAASLKREPSKSSIATATASPGNPFGPTGATDSSKSVQVGAMPSAGSSSSSSNSTTSSSKNPFGTNPFDAVAPAPKSAPAAAASVATATMASSPVSTNPFDFVGASGGGSGSGANGSSKTTGSGGSSKSSSGNGATTPISQTQQQQSTNPFDSFAPSAGSSAGKGGVTSAAAAAAPPLIVATAASPSSTSTTSSSTSASSTSSAATDTARRHAERMADLAATEAKAESERLATEDAREGVQRIVADWCGKAAWTGPKAMRKLMRQAAQAASMVGGAGEEEGKAAAALLVSQSLANLLRLLHTIPNLSSLVTKELLAPQKSAAEAPVTGTPLKKAYMLAVKALHPDKTGGSAADVRLVAENCFTVLNSAWELLGDAQTGAFLTSAAAASATEEV